LNNFPQTIFQAWSFKRNLKTLFVRENERWTFLDEYRAMGIIWVILRQKTITTKDYFRRGKMWGACQPDSFASSLGM